MAHIHEGSLLGTGKHIGIVVSRFNEVITKALLEGALNHLRRSGVKETDIEVAWVPGAFEIPLALKEFALRKNIDALISLGCIIRGETSNYEHLAQATMDAIAQVMLAHRIPVGFGVLTVDSYDQAVARSGGKVGNKGREAAQVVLEMASLMAQFREEESKAADRLLEEAQKEWSKNKFMHGTRY